MININKLRKLDKTLICRKVIRILYENSHNKNYSLEYIKEALTLCLDRVPSIKPLISNIKDEQSLIDIELILRKEIGEEQYDWDFIDKKIEGKNININTSVYVDRVRSPFNIGSICRTSEALGIKNIYLNPLCPSLDNKRLIKTSMGTLDNLNIEYLTDDEVINLNRPMVALELGGKSIDKFDFIDNLIMVIGSEEFGVSSKLLKACDNSLGRITIPLYGAKGSLNVSSAYSIAAFYMVNSLVSS